MPYQSNSIRSRDRSFSPQLKSQRPKSTKDLSRKQSKDEVNSVSCPTKDQRKEIKRDKKPTCLSVVISSKNVTNETTSVKIESSVKSVDKELSMKKRKRSVKELRNDNSQFSSVEDLTDLVLVKRKSNYIDGLSEVHKSKKICDNKLNQSYTKGGDLKSLSNSRDNVKKFQKQSPRNLVSATYSSPCSLISSCENSPIHYLDNRSRFDSNRSGLCNYQRSPKRYKLSIHTTDHSNYRCNQEEKCSTSRSGYSKTKNTKSNYEYERHRRQRSNSRDRVQYQRGSPQHKSSSKHSNDYYRDQDRSISRSRRSSSRNQTRVSTKTQISKDKKLNDYKDYSLSISQECVNEDKYKINSDSASPRSRQPSCSRRTSLRYRSRSNSDAKHHTHYNQSRLNKSSTSDDKCAKFEAKSSSNRRLENVSKSVRHSSSSSLTKRTNRRRSRSLSDNNQKEIKSLSSTPVLTFKPVELLFDLLSNLVCEYVSDSELDSVISPSKLTSNLINVTNDLDGFFDTEHKAGRVSSDDNFAIDQSQKSQSFDVVGSVIDEEKDGDPMNLSNSNFAMDSLEKFSNQMRQHMSGPETWDSNDSVGLFDEVDYSGDYLNPSVVSLASIKSLNSLEHSFNVPWQDLIESAVTNLTSVKELNLDSQETITCFGSAFELYDCLQSVVPLHKRPTGLKIFQTVGISRRFAGDFTVDNEVGGEKSNSSHLGWFNRSSMKVPSLFSAITNNNCNKHFFPIVPLNEQTDRHIRHQMLLHCV